MFKYVIRDIQIILAARAVQISTSRIRSSLERAGDSALSGFRPMSTRLINFISSGSKSREYKMSLVARMAFTPRSRRSKPQEGARQVDDSDEGGSVRLYVSLVDISGGLNHRDDISRDTYRQNSSPNDLLTALFTPFQPSPFHLSFARISL